MTILQLHHTFEVVPIYHMHALLHMQRSGHLKKQCKEQHQDTDMPQCETTLYIPCFCPMYLAANPKTNCVIVKSTDECFMALFNVDCTIPTDSFKKHRFCWEMF